MGIAPNIKLYGSATCNKTAYYRKWLEDREWAYTFLDVIRSEQHAEELKNLYENRKLNFPTFTIDGKKLRNPRDYELIKWINNKRRRRMYEQLKIRHQKDEDRFVMDIDGQEAEVIYRERDGNLYLVHSEVPPSMRGKGYGKILVEKTFEKLTEEGYKAVAVCPFIVAVARRSNRWNKVIKM